MIMSGSIQTVQRPWRTVFLFSYENGSRKDGV